MAKDWNNEQQAVLKANLHLTDAELVPLVNACGPKRSKRAVRWARQHKLKVSKAAVNRQECGRKSAAAAMGWPVLTGTDEERHERYCALVLAEFARLHPELVKVAA